MKQRIETIDDSPILIIKRDEPIAKVEEIKVVNNIAILSECPYHFTKVRIKDMFEIPENIYRSNKEIRENQYIVDYKFGFITFNPTMEGRTLTVEYDGTGTVLIPSSRIYDTGREDVIITLQGMIDGGRKAIEAYGNIDNAILIAKEEYAKINTSIEEGKKVNNDLNITIIKAKDINKILEGNIDKANNINNTLNGSVSSGTNKIQEMDNKISEVDNNELIRKSNEEQRRNSENIRITNESERNSNEDTRKSDETIRKNNEDERKTSDEIREKNEVVRQNAENVRIDNENKRIQSETIRETNEKDRKNTNNKMTNTINDISICEEYNENKEYKKLNRVTYNGSLYECKYGNVGILPTNKNCWICIAEKGKDGKDGLGSGDMHTSIYDKNGNGIVDVAEVAESVEWQNVKNKPDLSEIGKVKSVNGKTGEVKLTANDINAYDKTETDNKFATKDDLGNINVPVKKVNGKIGDINLTADDIIVTELATTVEEAILNNHTNVDGAIGDIKNIKSELAENTKQVNTKMDKQIKDDSNNKKYELGIKNGLLYYREV